MILLQHMETRKIMTSLKMENMKQKTEEEEYDQDDQDE